MKTYSDLQDRLKIELTHWFNLQCQNIFDDYYLYYTETIPGKSGGIIICKNPPSNDYKLAMPERINKGMTIDQNFYHIINTCLSKLPVLEA